MWSVEHFDSNVDIGDERRHFAVDSAVKAEILGSRTGRVGDRVGIEEGRVSGGFELRIGGGDAECGGAIGGGEG